MTAKRFLFLSVLSSLIIAAIGFWLVLAISWYALNHNSQVADEGVFYALGYTLGILVASGILAVVPTFIVGTILFLMQNLRKLKAVGYTLMSFSLIYMLLGAGLALSVVLVDHDGPTLSQDESEEMLAEAENVIDDETYAERVKQFKTAKQYLNNEELAEMGSYFARSHRRFEQQTEKMSAEIDQYRLEDIFSEESLTDSSALEAGRKRLQAARETTDQYEQKYLDLIESFYSEMGHLKIKNNDFKLGMMESAKNEGDQRKEDIHHLFSLERNLYDEMDGLLAFLSSRKDQYWFEKGQIVFRDQDDVDAYNHLVMHIHTLAKEEETLQARMKRNARISYEIYADSGMIQSEENPDAKSLSHS